MLLKKVGRTILKKVGRTFLIFLLGCSTVHSQRRPSGLESGQTTLKHTMPDGTHISLVTSYAETSSNAGVFSVTVTSQMPGEQLKECKLSTTISEDIDRAETCVVKKLAGIDGQGKWGGNEIASLTGEGLDVCLSTGEDQPAKVRKVLMGDLFNIVHDVGCSYSPY